MLVKKCSRCKEVKPVEDFHKNKSLSSGVHYMCKMCVSNYQRDHDRQINYKGRHVFKENVHNDIDIIWLSGGIFDDINEIKKEIFQIFSKHIGNKRWLRLSKYKGISGKELSKILEEFVQDGFLEKLYDEKTNQFGYRYKTIGISLSENNSMIVNPEH